MAVHMNKIVDIGLNRIVVDKIVVIDFDHSDREHILNRTALHIPVPVTVPVTEPASVIEPPALGTVVGARDNKTWHP